jgi:hypothetical protein
MHARTLPDLSIVRPISSLLAFRFVLSTIPPILLCMFSHWFRD